MRDIFNPWVTFNIPDDEKTVSGWLVGSTLEYSLPWFWVELAWLLVLLLRICQIGGSAVEDALQKTQTKIKTNFFCYVKSDIALLNTELTKSPCLGNSCLTMQHLSEIIKSFIAKKILFVGNICK